jgi:hypothetical protein
VPTETNLPIMEAGRWGEVEKRLPRPPRLSNSEN